MTDDTPNIEQALEYHRTLPLRVRDYLNRRGILDYQIDLHLLGHNGERITIPVRGQDGEISQFRLARDPNDLDSAPKMLSTPGSSAELYGWVWLHTKPDQVVVCEGEFDRLVLERFGFPAVTSTGGAGVFRDEWAEALADIPEVFVCFDRDEAGEKGARKVSRMIPGARIVDLPEEVGEGGDVTDYFIELGRRAADFETLLEEAEPGPERKGNENENRDASPSSRRSADHEVEQLKRSVRLEDVVQDYLPLKKQGRNWVGRCPFHDDRDPSFTVFPNTQTFYCFGCLESGDVITFLRQMEDLTFPEALDVLRDLDGA